MAMADRLFLMFLFPRVITGLYMSTPGLSEVLLAGLYVSYFSFLPNISSMVSTQSLIPKAVDRFGAVVFPLARNLVEHPEKLVCEIRWKEMFEEFSFPRSCYTTAQSVVLFTCLSPLWPPCTLS